MVYPLVLLGDKVSFPPNLGVLVWVAWALSWSLGLVMLLVGCRRGGL